MENTPNLALPYIASAQAQKHVTHNEALRMLDALVNLTATSRLPNQPAAPQDGERFIVEAGGDWNQAEGLIAAWQDDAWAYLVPKTGWRCYLASEAAIVVWNGIQWLSLAGGAEPDRLDQLGINTDADTTNRLSVSAAGTLLDNEGAGHRLAVNKAASGDTASLVFQTGYTGHAEMGLAGDDGFQIKTSPDGSSWATSVETDPATGVVRFPSGIEGYPLSGVPEDIEAFDRIFLDSVNGDDANDGLSDITAIRTLTELGNRFSVGRRLEVFLLSDITFDASIRIGYVVPTLSIYGRKADNSGWQNRKVTVIDAVNRTDYPGGFVFFSFTSVYTFRIDIELATSNNQSVFNFFNSIGFLRTNIMTLTRTGTGGCCLFANGVSFVPSQHTSLNVDVSAAGYVANGLSAGTNPNSDWRYPCNLSSLD